jgi:plastocyanin
MSAPALFASATLASLAVAAGSADAAMIDVHLKDQSFEPRAISASPGDTIVFYNDDKELHSILIPGYQTLLAEHFIDPGTKREVVIPATADPATYNLVCTIHMNMKGTIQIITK